MNKCKPVGAVMLVMALLLGLMTGPVYAEDGVLEIATPEAFLEFSQLCRYDAYSEGLTVRLTANLDMTDLPFEDIPIFLGTFDGGGHTISGFSGSLEKDGQGLFRHIAQGASVSNLTVLSTMKTEHATIGGIAAENYGTIQNCVYRGIVSGLDTIGGIAAENYGTIVNCSVSGGIFGESQVGGVVGVNQGTLLQCYNYAEVNTNIMDFEFTVETQLVSNINPNSDTINIADIGGIAGRSDGIVKSCINRGTVGYPHVGYNIGGIVGAQSGYVANCTNMGAVQGRKEVGGIVGQFEPYVDTLYSLSKLQELREELDVLSQYTSSLASNAKDSNSLLSDEFDQLGQSIDQSKDQVSALMDQTQSMVNDNVDTINQLSVTVADTLDALSPIVDSVDPVLDNLSRAMDDFQGMADDLGDTVVAMEEVGDVAEEIVEDLSTAQSSWSSGISDLKTALSLLDELSPSVESITTVLTDMAAYFQQGMDSLDSAQSALADAIGQLDEMGDGMEDVGDELQDALYQMEEAFDNLGDATEDLQETKDLISQLIEDLRAREELVFTKFDESYDESRDALSNSLSQMGDDLSQINTSAHASGDLLVDDLDKVSQQVTSIFDLVLEMMQDVTSFVEDETYKVEDVSTIDTSHIVAGKVTDCKNNATVAGDINVGGIVGGISFELSFDMEDTWKTDRDKTQSITRQGMAVVENATNIGDVTAKKDSVGGIVGYQDFGLVQNCTAGASVESSEGNYVGGIVGQSNGYVRSCYAKTTLSGGQFIGGIAGAGYDVQGCYALTAVNATKGGTGGIVGDLDTDGTLQNNFFVSDTLGGLDGISYRGMAESIAYAELLKVEHIPSLFQSMTVRFYVEDALVDTCAVDFGTAISPELVPVMAEKAGYYSRWEPFDTVAVTSDLKIQGSYILLLPTLGGAKNQAGVATVLVDGAFTEDETLVVSQDGNVYTLWIEGERSQITGLRCLVPDGNGTIQILENGIWVEAETQVDGKYLRCTVASAEKVTFQVVEQSTTDDSILVLIGLSATFVTVAAVALVMKQKKPKASSQKP